MTLRNVKLNYYLVTLLGLTILSRLIYHTNTPFFEDEGLFLLDSSKNIFNIYIDTLYMKPYIGALYYSIIYNLAGSNSFLWLHISTTIFIVISNLFIYLIVKQKTENDLIALLSGLLFLTFTNLSVGGYAHSSLEHFQLIFLLSAYYFLYILNINNIGLILLSFAVMIKQNIALTGLALVKIIYNNWKTSIFIFTIWLLISIFFFENIFFNTLVFPAKYYNTYGIEEKILNIYNYFLKAGYWFNTLITISFLFASFEFYKKYKNEFLFIILIGISLLFTPLYPQHFVILFPFLIIVSSLFFNKILINNKINIYAIGGGIMILLMFNAIKLYKNSNFTFNEYSLTKIQTLNARLDGNKKGLRKLYEYLSVMKDKKVFIYPILAPHFYILNDLKTIDAYYSNDHFETIIKNDFLRNKLLKSIENSSPEYLIKMKDSNFDSYIKKLEEVKYQLYQEFYDIKIYKIKEQYK